jgi:ABC-2 type transport system permease protein
VKQLVAHFKAQMLELVRIPGLWVPVLGIPGALFLFFGAPDAHDQASSIQAMAAYAAFGVLGVAFFQFGVLVASDRDAPWEVYLRTLPVSPLVRFAARILSGLIFALAVIALIGLEAVLWTPVRLEIGGWVALCLTLLLGSVPFGLLGIALGYWAHPRAASAVANLLWIVLTYAGGIWGEPIQPVRIVSPFLPTRLYIDAIWPVAAGQGWPARPWLGLMAYAVAGGVLAIWGYRRDEGQNYR